MSMTRGGRNLAILGVGAILFAFVTTFISMSIYRASGDIYLDRSRPGYLPDEEEVNEEDTNLDSEFTFSESGPLTASELDAYIDALYATSNRLHGITPYSPEPLSDASLGIPSEFTEEPDKTYLDSIESIL